MDRIIAKINEGKKVVIIGIGNRLRRDDGIGSIIAEKLKEKIKRENLFIIDAENTPENYIGKIKKVSPELLLIIDAVDFGSYPGDFRIFKINEIRETTISTHNFSISLLKKFIKADEIYLLGIQPGNISLGENLTDKVKKTVEKIIEKFNFLPTTPKPYHSTIPPAHLRGGKKG
jgi:hydrogenase 3 maturation protease